MIEVPWPRVNSGGVAIGKPVKGTHRLRAQPDTRSDAELNCNSRRSKVSTVVSMPRCSVSFGTLKVGKSESRVIKLTKYGEEKDWDGGDLRRSNCGRIE
jgi:hypothetical protein